MGEKVRAAALAILALGLAGCRDRASIPGEAAVAPPAAGQGPVNPDAGVTGYVCVDGQTITAGYPDRRTAIVTYKGHAYTLKLAPSASGARYTGYGLQWWTKGASATIAALKPGEEAATAPGLECSPQGPLGAEPVTRTSYKP